MSSFITLLHDVGRKMLTFILDVKDFSDWLRWGSRADAAPDNKDDAHAAFSKIVDKYIKDGSPFEVNIESKTKKAILAMTDKKTFNALTLVRPKPWLSHRYSSVAAVGLCSGVPQDLIIVYIKITLFSHVQYHL